MSSERTTTMEIRDHRKYQKCWHEALKTFKIAKAKAMKYSLISKSVYLFISTLVYLIVDLVNHLMTEFSDLFRLYVSFQNRDTLPTPLEVNIALAVKDCDAADIPKHLEFLNIPSSRCL